jgi:hypothetical protein
MTFVFLHPACTVIGKIGNGVRPVIAVHRQPAWFSTRSTAIDRRL